MTYSCMRMHTTIGAVAFHFRVRDGNGWGHNAIVTEQAGEAALGAPACMGWDIVASESVEVTTYRKSKAT